MGDVVNEQVGGGVEFGRLLAGLRIGRGLSQEELADRSGMSVRAIRNLEHGHVQRPRRTSVVLLADGLALTGAERAAFNNAALSPAGPPGTKMIDLDVLPPGQTAELLLWQFTRKRLAQALTRLLVDIIDAYACWNQWEPTHHTAQGEMDSAPLTAPGRTGRSGRGRCR